MSPLLLPTLAILALAAEPLPSGDLTRSVRVGESTRPYLLHVPKSYNSEKPTPLVLALHPFATNGPLMARISGLSKTADRHGFLVAYPNGTGVGTLLHWNVGLTSGDRADDMGYLAQVLDDLSAIANIDPRRVYATGFSNGGMMCYRLAAEWSDRIAAIAPVSGTRISGKIEPKRPVSVLHFHGTEDQFVAYNGRLWRQTGPNRLLGVDETIQSWAVFNGCNPEPVFTAVPLQDDDGLSVERSLYGPGRDGSEVILYKIQGGGHTWPGRE
ncbi:MAG TPA: PHB depolymerase family esterase, partial [Isosphaeraceae bacterium]|nr:PHB depolymerase family esterase [Isosphaeraceae bacterium]